jgi:glycerophosphoryl diester phosphodiesterase
MTLEEVIELMLNMNSNFKRTDREMIVGLYIETKQYGFYLENYGQDIAEMLYNTLKRFDIETIEKANKKLPIIIQSFESDALMKFS